MNGYILTILILCVVLVLGVIAVVTGRFLRMTEMAYPPPRPCYRCGILATTDFMGLHYCMMCSGIVARAMPLVRHDPPYGFPGASGYLEFPETEQKKES